MNNYYVGLEENEHMKNRLYALTQIGKFCGIEMMIGQVKEEEKAELRHYLNRFYLNIHGMNQEAEGIAWGFRQEGAVLGYRYLDALMDHLYK